MVVTCKLTIIVYTSVHDESTVQGSAEKSHDGVSVCLFHHYWILVKLNISLNY